MTPEVWSQIRQAVEAASALAPEARPAYLDSLPLDAALRAEVEQLLGFQSEASQLFDPADRPWLFDAAAALEPNLAGALLGHYRLIEEIGRGGMGAVYLAERADGTYNQRVALKVLQQSIFTPRLAERFAAERQILARLAHPGIARLLDGGLTPDGRPFLVLEYVDGLRIDRFCDEHHLDLAARLRLFVKVAEAVQAAHQQLILHLDLKPANILVTPAGEPRLLDFGIARALGEAAPASEFAETTLRLLTPHYASPEQTRGLPLGVASDVFSLGTLLYKLLTHKLPYPLDDAPPLEAARMINEQAPLPPSQAAPQADGGALRGDLDTILLQALRKEPERRYQTVAAFADDISRYLDSRPVLAHADSLRYRSSKFVRRNRGYLSVAAVSVLLIAASIAAVVHAAVLARRSERQAERAEAVAEHRLNDERDLAHSYIFDLDPMLKEIPKTVPVRVFILKHALKYLDSISRENIGDDDLAREVADGYLNVAEVQSDTAEPSMNDRAGAGDSMNRSYVIQKRLFDQHPGDMKQRFLLLRTLRRMGFLAVDSGDLLRSEQLEQQAWELGQPIAAAGPSTRGYATMIAIAWDMANLHAGNGGSWSLADPVGTQPWVDRMNVLLRAYTAASANNPAKRADAVGLRERAELTEAEIARQMQQPEQARAHFAESVRLGSDGIEGTLVEQEAAMVSRYSFAEFLLGLRETAQAAKLSPDVPPAMKLTDANHSEVAQRADILAQKARIDLQSGRLAMGRSKMDEALTDFEAIYRLDSEDFTNLGELYSSCIDFASEPILPREERRRLYQRAIDLIEPFARKHPAALSLLVDESKARIGLARLAQDAGDHTAQRQHALLAQQMLQSVLAAHPVQPEAAMLLTQAQGLL
jgi:non-specific serine/threonine protein kinase/serine/threonine-protein kinase